MFLTRNAVIYSSHWMDLNDRIFLPTIRFYDIFSFYENRRTASAVSFFDKRKSPYICMEIFFHRDGNTYDGFL